MSRLASTQLRFLTRVVARFCFTALLAGVLLGLLPVGCALDGDQPEEENQAPLSVGTFTSDASGFDTHSFYVDTGREVVVVDAQFTPELARRAIAQIQAQTTSPITHVVVTHPNPDKFNGLAAFQAIGAQAVASEATAAAIPAVHAYKKDYFVHVAGLFSESTYPAEARIDRTFRGDLKLPLHSGHTLRLHELEHSGVTTTQTVAYVPAAKALFVGDLVHHRAHAWLEGGIVAGRATPNLTAWAAALSELSAYPEATVYGGRGELAAVTTAVAAQTTYLRDVEVLARTYVASLGGTAKAELSGANVGQHYKKVAMQVGEKYPQYALPYLIEYGVYGLLNQLAGL